MPRPRTGTVYSHGDHWDVRITLPDGSRSNPICLPRGTSEAKAREKARSLTELAAREGGTLDRPDKPDAPAGEAFSAWSDRWFTAREERGLSAVENDRGRVRKWVLPRLGPIPVAHVTRDDVERLVEYLDANVRAGELSWKTAINVWGLVAKMFDDARSAKIRTLRVRSDNPTAGVRGPDRGVKKAKAYLYPTEFQTLISCEAISLQWRRAIALAVYLYTRASELRALTWDDIDVERGIVHIHRGMDREGATKSTKTGLTRRFAVEPELLPLLQAMHAEAGGVGQVIAIPDDRHLARALRALLEKAGLTRADLFAKDATRKNMTWHDLRATGITWMAIRGDDPLKIMQRAGHSDFRTTQVYIREAEAVREGFGEVFPPLPPDLLGEGVSSGNRQRAGQVPEIMVEALGIEPSLNPHDPLVSRGFSHVEEEGNQRTSTPNPAIPRDVDDSQTKPANPRAALFGHLAADMSAAIGAGDIAAARVAFEAIGKLLDAVGAGPGGVVDLAAERARRS